ncbi:MAG: YCF48-related protein, partial [bacterium]
IYGSLNTQGLSNAPVVFTGYSQANGYWDGLEVYGYANLNYTNILYGGYPHYAKASNLYVEGRLTLNNCLIGSSSNYGIWINNGEASIENCSFLNNYYGVWAKNGNTTILYSKIFNNQIGILTNTGRVFIRKSLLDNPININNSSNSLLDARKNYWGTYPVDRIKLVQSPGGILYLPCLSSYEGITNPRPAPTPPSITGWTKKSQGITSHLLDIDNGWICGDEGIVGNIEKNSTFTLASTSTFFGISFVSTNTGWVVGENGLVFKTEDGNSFYRQAIPTKLNLYGIDFTNENKGCIVGEKGIILITEDGGKNYNLAISPTNADLFKIKFLDESYGFTVGNGVILKTHDGGKAWNKAYEGTNTKLSLFFLNPKEGWVVGENGLVLHTIDGGINWETQKTPTNNTLFDISFYKGILLSTGNGIILQSLNYGKTWNIISSGLSFSIQSIKEFLITTENGGIFQYPFIY